MKKPILGGFLAIASLAFLPYTSIAAEAPKLILQITVDQLRSDLPQRYMSKMGDGGFKYLYNQGIVYEDYQLLILPIYIGSPLMKSVRRISMLELST